MRIGNPNKNHSSAMMVGVLWPCQLTRKFQTFYLLNCFKIRKNQPTSIRKCNCVILISWLLQYLFILCIRKGPKLWPNKFLACHITGGNFSFLGGWRERSNTVKTFLSFKADSHKLCLTHLQLWSNPKQQFTFLVKSKPVKQEVSLGTVILPHMVSVLWL